MSQAHVPELYDEINRKSITAIDTILTNQASGLYSVETALACCHTVFNTVSGITRPDVSDLISEAVEQFEQQSQQSPT